MRRSYPRLCVLFFLAFLIVPNVRGDDGYDLWLRYHPIADEALGQQYRMSISHLLMEGESPTLQVTQEELQRGLHGLLGMELPMGSSKMMQAGTLIVGTPASSPIIAALNLDAALQQVGEEGFVIQAVAVDGKHTTVITANTDVGVLYGTFHFLRLLQTHQPIDNLAIVSTPKIQHRLLNHWDNLDRTVERGYAGFSLWDWHKLPDYLDPRYTDYARANASIGINGTVLTNVNANALVLTPMYLEKAAALADVFRSYGIRVYLTARFSAPIEIGSLETADPLNPDVQAWWQAKANEIYSYIPDFGGFLVKANSEGQPGPQDYDRSHADGANMLADAVAPHGGIVMWRAFVYSNEEPEDRAKQAFNEFVPLDGTFRDNVLIQVKNGPIDFQPREPFHPLFGAMPGTPLMMEFQITKEYLGQGTHLAYLAPMWKEVLDADTYAQGKGSTVAEVIDGSLHSYELTGIAGVANTGTDRNWAGSHFDQANWYAFGRLAWNHTLSSEAIAEEWIAMTFTNNVAFIEPVLGMMMQSWPAVVDYMTPLGLHHLMATGHHYGPGPWVSNLSRGDWNPVYYHRADSVGIGFNRTATGSDAVSQYVEPLDGIYGSRDRVPEKYLLWFHHLPWDYEMNSGRTLWEELMYRYNRGVETVREMQQMWASFEGMIDRERYDQIAAFLAIQEKEAVWWRDASLSYFQTFSGQSIPDEYEQPAHTLEYYQNLSFPYAPGH
ncbi:MAG TPA: alpha-glucuronidase family glycosyl hydrolase [Rhodothermales bacterium]|nr:alpha-glucuronidase family glycosyl hydrolase [Rhodothermales bacterium]